jgi:ATPase family associated with various cellular activities (AAA)
MRREPSLTLRGALETLGHHDRPRIDRLNAILGGVILASGAAAGAAALGGAALPAAGLWIAIFGWVEQKDTAVGLLRKVVDSVTGKLSGTSRYERGQLIAAAHTTVVVAAYFEALREQLGKEFYDALKISDAEKETLMSGHLRQGGQMLFESLYAAEVPAPSAARGFEENIAAVSYWLDTFDSIVRDFLGGLAAASGRSLGSRPVTDAAVERYRSHYLELAAKVPDFKIWTMLDEHAATRSLVREQSAEIAEDVNQHTAAVVRDLNAELARVLNQQSSALARVEALLTLISGPAGAITDLRAIVERANQSILEQPIILTDASGQPPDVTIPSVSQMYINPRYRVAPSGPNARVADATWWDDRPSRAEFDLLLTAHVTTPDATRAPMLLLGDPGAGKSLLTQVLAARLPASGYTVVRVPLRSIGANAPIGDQIQQGLDLFTAKRVDWGKLSDQSAGTIRVVALDGLDELLQASSNDRSGYLQEVMAFQEAEAAQERPIIVIVTSRIVVADRVDIPAGTTVVKLDNFTNDDVADWLERWHAANAPAITAGKVRTLTLDQALRQPELAQQPLLLLMLALYGADPALPALTAKLSTADLYRVLLDEFARREAKKSLGDYARGRVVDERVRDHLDRLAVTALAMFNRGRQDISADQVGKDLAALDERLMGRSRTDEAGQLVIGEFFFMHAPEAQLLTTTSWTSAHAKGRQDNGRSRDGQPRRSYEFLHATFGEYLVASYLLTELVGVAAEAFARPRGPVEPNDNLLFALLSHQPLATRRSALDFAGQIGAALPPAERRKVCDVLEMLVESYRDRHDSGQYPSYRPTATDTVRQLACYSANLVLLRTALEPDNGIVPLTNLLRVPDNGVGLSQWRSMVRLWQSGLDADGIRAVLTSLCFSASPTGVRAGSEVFSMILGPGPSMAREAIEIAQLMGDEDSALRTRYGAALWDDYSEYYSSNPESKLHSIASVLISVIVGRAGEARILQEVTEISEDNAGMMAALIFNFLRTAPADFSEGIPFLYAQKSRSDRKGEVSIGGRGLEEVMKSLFSLPRVFEFDQYALARAIILRPRLLDEVPELREADLYGPMYELIRIAGTPKLLSAIEHGANQEAVPSLTPEELLREVIRSGGAARQWNFKNRAAAAVNLDDDAEGDDVDLGI